MILATLEKYVAPITVSVGLHGALLYFLLVGWQPERPPQEVKRPNFVQAKLVKLEDQTKREVPKPEKPQVVDLEKKRQEQEKQEQQRQQQAEQKKQQEIKRKEDEAKKVKAEAERKKKEQETKAKEAADKKARTEAEKKKQQEQQRKQNEQQAFEQALAQEEMRLQEESFAVTAQSYMSVISQRIEQNWSRPPSARNGMQCELRIQLVPTGRVVNVDVTQSSGNALFDLSAVQAVKKAEQFPEIKDMPPEVFERYYRELTLVFRPQDLRQ